MADDQHDPPPDPWHVNRSPSCIDSVQDALRNSLRVREVDARLVVICRHRRIGWPGLHRDDPQTPWREPVAHTPKVPVDQRFCRPVHIVGAPGADAGIRLLRELEIAHLFVYCNDIPVADLPH